MDFQRYLATATICMLILTGCNTGPAVDNEPTPTPITAPVPSGEKQTGTEPTLEPHQYTDAQGLPFPIPSTEANPILSVSRDIAWGSNLDIKEIPASIDEDHMFLLKAVSEDGKTLAGQIVPRERTSFEATRLALMDVDTMRITEIATTPEQYAGSVYAWGSDAAIDGEWVVWSEGSAFQIYNITTQARSQIEIGADPRIAIPGAYISLRGTVAIDHGIVVWAEATSEEPGEGKLASVVKSADLITRQTSVIGHHGTHPAISWPTVTWIDLDRTTEIDGQALGRLVTLDIQTGVTKVLSVSQGFTEVAVSGDTLVWTNWDSSAGAVLSNLAETRRQVIAPQQSASLQNLTVNERLVVSSNGAVWDRNLSRLVRLNENQRAGPVMLKGPMLAWQTVPRYNQQMGYEPDTLQPDAMKIYLLDTSQLPK